MKKYSGILIGIVFCCLLLTSCAHRERAVSSTIAYPRAVLSSAPRRAVPRTSSPPAPENAVQRTASDPEPADGAVHADAYSDRTPYSPTVLMYHLVEEKPFTSLTNLFLRPSEFEDQLQSLNQAGYEYRFADDFTYSSRKGVMLTFDDGYEDNYTNMFPLLKKYHAKATIFMIAGSVGRSGSLTADMIREMAASGLVRIESHTVSHTDLRNLSDQALEREFVDSRKILSDLTGQPVNAICYPAGGVNKRVAASAARYFRYGYTTKNEANTRGCDPMEIPRLRIFRGESGRSLVAALK